MKAHLVLAAALALAALSTLPTAQAMETPPPCQTMTTCCGIEPAFAPCCSVLTCPPPVARCPTTQLRTSDLLAYLGPHATVETGSDCHVDACVDSSTCSASQCDADGACCTLDGAQSACASVGSPAQCTFEPPVPMLMMALPIPNVSSAIHPDCTATVYETYDCPNGFWDFTTHYDAGPVDVYADYCGPMCACMPMDVATLPEVLR